MPKQLNTKLVPMQNLAKTHDILVIIVVIYSTGRGYIGMLYE